MAGIADDLNGIKGDVADLRGNNQVARFAYTQDAYTNDEAAGTASFDIGQDNNIPTKDAATLNVNPTILDRGYQTQASSLTRQLQNHFFGRVSYNLNKIVDRVWEALGTLSAAMGRSDSAAGDKTYIATLDANGRLPSNQLTEDAMEIKAYWDASTNTPDLTDAANKKPGNVYYVSTEGTRDIGGGSKTYYIGDVLICNRSLQWERIPVTYVKGGAENASAYRTGKVDVTLTSLGISNVKNYDQSKALNGITATQNAASTELSLSRLDSSTAATATINAMTGASSNAAGKAGLVKQPAAGDNTKFLRGDATWAVPTNTTYSVFVKSGSTAAAGLVPAPSTTAGTTKYLCEDATWKEIPTASSSVLGGVKVGFGLSISSGSLRTTNEELAAAFSTSTAYPVGRIVTHNGHLYKCNTAHTAGAWDASHFTSITAFGGSAVANSQNSGMVPYLKSSSQSSYFLRGDNTWQLLSGATVGNATSAGYAGLAGILEDTLTAIYTTECMHYTGNTVVSTGTSYSNYWTAKLIFTGSTMGCAYGAIIVRTNFPDTTFGNTSAITWTFASMLPSANLHYIPLTNPKIYSTQSYADRSYTFSFPAFTTSTSLQTLTMSVGAGSAGQYIGSGTEIVLPVMLVTI